jgi:hypothetical protein
VFGGVSALAGSFQHRLRSTQHLGRVQGSFDLCEIISTTHLFQVLGSVIFRSIWPTWKAVAGLVSPTVEEGYPLSP